MAWSAGTKGVVRGKAVLAPSSKKELDEMKQKGTIAGAWVVMPRTGGGRPGLSQNASQRARRCQGGRDHRRFWRRLAGDVGRVSDLLGQASDAARRSRSLRKQYDEIAGWLKEGKPVTLEFDIRNYFKKGPIKLYNVIADIPGTEKPDEYVIVGGHIDSWDGATGATDNGTGCATALEAARILMKAGVKPKRTIRFMLWSGEEQGLLGSAAYVKAHKDLMPKISAVLVHDGGTNYLSGIGATEAIMSDFEQVFTPVKELDPKNFRSRCARFPAYVAAAAITRRSCRRTFRVSSGGRRARLAISTPTTRSSTPTTRRIRSIRSTRRWWWRSGRMGIANLDHLLSREKLRTAGAMAGGATAEDSGVQLDDDEGRRDG